MITTYAQAERLLRVFTPLGKDVLLLVGFQGQEAISQPFRFELEVVAQNEVQVPFDKLLGQMLTVDLLLPNRKRRYFHGICNQVSQGRQDFSFTTYWLQIVPPLWLLTKRAQSRIFQRLTVPDILKKVLDGLNVAYEISGSWHPRDYCAQYRESDFAFASRLMEEEGIYYFFKHTPGGVQMVVANTPQSHPEVPEASTLIYEELKGGLRFQDRITEWRKVQELRSGKVTLWDHCFELPHKRLEAGRGILDAVPVGEVSQSQRVADNHRLEWYDYPGAYAQRFDGVSAFGSDRSGDLQKIYEDNQRTATIRMQQEAVPGLYTQGRSNCRQMTSGHRFTLTRHFNANGPYVLTSVTHEARLHADYRSGGPPKYDYVNTFTCIPLAQPFRPQRVTPRPFVQGAQTAVVVGPPGEEIFVDKYGRVKVQFHWDRQGQRDADSSCWVRVTQPWAGKRWGGHFWPRIGQEVIVDFLEGDPDRPIITGTVYNADQMPPYDLPANKTRSGLKTRSSRTGTPENFNELRFEDKKDQEEIYFHAERDFNRVVENNDTLKVGFEKQEKGDQTTAIFNNQSLTVGCREAPDGSQTTAIFNNQKLTVGCPQAPDGSQTIDVWKNRTEVVRTGDEAVTIAQGNRTHDVYADDTLVVRTGNRTVLIETGGQTTQAAQFIELRVGSSSLRLDPHSITLSATLININGTAAVQTNAPLVGTSGVLVAEAAVLSQTDAILLNKQGILSNMEAAALLHLGGGMTLIGPPKSAGAAFALGATTAAAGVATSVAFTAVSSGVTGTADPLAIASAGLGVAGSVAPLAASTAKAAKPVELAAGGFAETAAVAPGVVVPPVSRAVAPAADDLEAPEASQPAPAEGAEGGRTNDSSNSK